LEEWNKT